MKLANLFSTAKTLAGRYGPEIYVGAGIGLSILTAIMVAKETPKALRLQEEIEETEDREATVKEKAIILGKTYWPAICTGAASIFFIISGHHIQYKRTAAATAAYLLAQDSLKNFTDKVTEEIGEKKVRDIKDKISKEKIFDNPVNDDVVIRTSNGDTLCFDAIAGRYFYSSAEAIRKAENEMNKRMLRDNFISLNEFYLELDLPPIKYGDELGWDVNLEGATEIDFSSHLNSNNQPCLVIDSDICPRWHLYS